MKNHVWSDGEHKSPSTVVTYPIAMLIKESAWNIEEIRSTYLEDISLDDVILVSLKYDTEKKVTAATKKDHIESMLRGLKAVGSKILYCADAEYFKTLTKKTKAAENLGYKFPCAIEGYEDMEVVLGINHKQVLYNPAIRPKLTISLDTLKSVIDGTYVEPGGNVLEDHYQFHDIGPDSMFVSEAAAYFGEQKFKNTEYIQLTRESYNHTHPSEWWFEELHNHPVITLDLETTSLDFWKAEITSIGFGVSETSARTRSVSRPVFDNGSRNAWATGTYAALKKFLKEYQGTIVYHNAAYDIKILLHTLWMRDLEDTEGMLQGLEVLTKNFEDTKIIAYLATNNTGGNKLGLKELAQPYLGNYSENIDFDSTQFKEGPYGGISNKITIILAHYNALDCVATMWVYNKYYPIMVADNQEDIYKTLMKPSLKTIIAAEMTGMSIDPRKVQALKEELEVTVDRAADKLRFHKLVDKFILVHQQKLMEKTNAKLKVKQYPLSHFNSVKFNPSSPDQVRELLYDIAGLPVIAKTKSKKASTQSKTLDRLHNHTSDKNTIELLNLLKIHSKATKILQAFIPAFTSAPLRHEPECFESLLFGNFNLGGTVSGRLSSSGPNLQNLPSGSQFGKLVKECFIAPKGWVMCGADFNALESRIDALTTRDPEKLKIYTDGYDSHSFNTYTYWPDQLPGIVDTAESVNTIQATHDHLRSKSKAVTFALQYGGTPITLVNNSGFSSDEACAVYDNYVEKYKVSMDYREAKIKQATIDGYVTVAFGLRVRTPLLASTILGNKVTPYRSEAEARTAGNALSQSYGLLTNRSANATMERVWKSKWRTSIKLIAMIHDANYFICKDDVECIEFLNNVLLEEMSWQELPEISHANVNLSAELEIYAPNWANAIAIPPGATSEDILQIAKDNRAEDYEHDAKKTA